MSRCFPFPPPGYERKLRVDDDNLLAKEKDKKEKKHKKDKDKQKKEGIEKDRERSKEKHREKDKEKKEKHKHKDRDKKKEKSETRDEKSFGGGSFNVEKVGSNSPQISQFTESSGRDKLLDRVAASTNGYSSEGKLVVNQKANGQRDDSRTRFPKVAFVCNLNGMEQRRNGIVRPMEEDVNKPTEGKQKQKHHKTDKKGDKNKDRDGKRFEGQVETSNLEKFVNNGIQIDPPKEASFVQELGRRIRDENGATGSQIIAKSNATNQKRDESIEKIANASAKEAANFRNGIHKKENGQKENNESKGSKIAIVHNFKGLEQKGREMVGRIDMGKMAHFERTETNGYGGSGSMGDRKRKIQAIDKDTHKARDEKPKQGSDDIIKLSRSGEISSDFTNGSKQYGFKASDNRAPEGITGKRKEPEANGSLHENEIRPNKLPRTIVSSQPITANGRKMQPCTTITFSTSKQGTSNDLKLDNKEQKINGTMISAQQSPLASTKPTSVNSKTNGLPIVAQEHPLGSTKPPFSTTKANGMMPVVNVSPLDSRKPSSTSTKSKHKVKSSSKPRSPHPDTKYLSQIFSVPKIEECSQFDDQEWLFSNNICPSKETKTCSATDEEQHRVWAKALQIQPADVCALPYVIPY